MLSRPPAHPSIDYSIIALKRAQYVNTTLVGGVLSLSFHDIPQQSSDLTFRTLHGRSSLLNICSAWKMYGAHVLSAARTNVRCSSSTPYSIAALLCRGRFRYCLRRCVPYSHPSRAIRGTNCPTWSARLTAVLVQRGYQAYIFTNPSSPQLAIMRGSEGFHVTELQRGAWAPLSRATKAPVDLW